MREVKQSPPHETLDRILNALEQELIEASDAELMQAASDLGMKPGMKGSAAFMGLRYSSGLRDFFAGGLTPETWAAIQALRRAQGLLTEDPSQPRPLRATHSRKVRMEPDKDE